MRVDFFRWPARTVRVHKVRMEATKNPLIASTATVVAFRAIQDWDRLGQISHRGGILQYIPRYSANLGWEQGYIMLYEPCIAKSAQKRKTIISKKVLQKIGHPTCSNSRIPKDSCNIHLHNRLGSHYLGSPQPKSFAE